MKYLLIILTVLLPLSAFGSDDSTPLTVSQLRQKGLSELRAIITDLQGVIEERNINELLIEKQRDEAREEIVKSREEYNFVREWGIEQNRNLVIAIDNNAKLEVKVKELNRSVFLCKAIISVTLGILVFIVTVNMMSWASFPLNLIVPFGTAGLAAGAVWLIL